MYLFYKERIKMLLLILSSNIYINYLNENYRQKNREMERWVRLAIANQ